MVLATISGPSLLSNKHGRFGWIAAAANVLTQLHDATTFARAAAGDYGVAVIWDDGEGVPRLLELPSGEIEFTMKRLRNPSYAVRRKPVEPLTGHRRHIIAGGISGPAFWPALAANILRCAALCVSMAAKQRK
jgi:hypothetical protein